MTWFISWFQSYLTNGTEYISLGHSKSNPHTLAVSPRGQSLAPSSPSLILLGQVISCHCFSFHCYDDDTQLYCSCNPTLIITVVPVKTHHVSGGDNGMNGAQLPPTQQLNNRAILVGTPHQTKSSSITSITFSGSDIPLSSALTTLGVKN